MNASDGDWHPVASLADIDDPGSRSFQVDAQGMPVSGFIVRHGGELFGYENVCPHAGRPLNWGPHRYLNEDHSLIRCVAHGALFEIASGECIAGPCAGESLRPIALRVVGDEIEADLSTAGML